MLQIYGLSASESLAKEVVAPACLDPSYNLQKFSDGEFQPQFNLCMRGDTVVLIQSTVSSDAFMELAFAIDACKRASAGQIIACIPYYGWGRQDRKDRPRIPIASKAVADMLQAVGCDRIITLDLHADQLQGFFDIPVDHVYADKVMTSALRDYLEAWMKSLKEAYRVCVTIPSTETLKDRIVIVSPDMGGAKRATRYAKELGLQNVVFCYKTRTKANVVDSINVAGDVKGKLCIIVDDMVDTAGTLCKVAEQLKALGAEKVLASATHAVLSGSAIEKVTNSVIDTVFISNTIQKQDLPEKFVVVSVANLLKNIIRRVESEESIEGL